MASDEVLVFGYAPGDDAPRRTVVSEAPPHVVVLRGGEADLAETGRHARLALARTPDGSTRSVGDETAIDELALKLPSGATVPRLGTARPPSMPSGIMVNRRGGRRPCC